MKTIRFITATLLAMFCSTASAQYYDEYGNWRESRYTSNASYYNDDYEEGWCSFYGGYAPMQLHTTVIGAEDRLFHTATVGFGYNYQLGYSPVYLTTMFEASGAWFTERYNNGDKYNFNLYYAKIPINIALRFNLAPEFAIVPFGGVSVKWNIYAEEIDRDKYGNYDKWVIFNGNYTYDYDYRRFQFGYQAGLKLIAGGCFSISAAWTADVTSFCNYYNNSTRRNETEKFKGVSFTLGYEF